MHEAKLLKLKEVVPHETRKLNFKAYNPGLLPPFDKEYNRNDPLTSASFLKVDPKSHNWVKTSQVKNLEFKDLKQSFVD